MSSSARPARSSAPASRGRILAESRCTPGAPRASVPPPGRARRQRRRWRALPARQWPGHVRLAVHQEQRWLLPRQHPRRGGVRRRLSSTTRRARRAAGGRSCPRAAHRSRTVRAQSSASTVPMPVTMAQLCGAQALHVAPRRGPGDPLALTARPSPCARRGMPPSWRARAPARGAAGPGSPPSCASTSARAPSSTRIPAARSRQTAAVDARDGVLQGRHHARHDPAR
jgi:hypothetical protein